MTWTKIPNDHSNFARVDKTQEELIAASARFAPVFVYEVA